VKGNFKIWQIQAEECGCRCRMERILKEEADISHPMSMPALQARLKEEGVEADRRTVYSDH